jgi:GNAT superfamily N-acetyltransferase
VHARSDLLVRPASVDDVDAVLDLLADAAAWTAAIGHANWPARFPRGLVEANAEAGELYLASRAGEIVGTLALQWSDAYFWGDAGEDGRAGYVHRVVVRRPYARAGLGAQLLAWADDEVRARDRCFLRLDVVSHNEPLRRYYEGAGFAHVRDVSGEWTARDGTRRAWRTSLYERPCP